MGGVGYGSAWLLVLATAPPSPARNHRWPSGDFSPVSAVLTAGCCCFVMFLHDMLIDRDDPLRGVLA
jgi:hypothetical protein